MPTDSRIVDPPIVLPHWLVGPDPEGHWLALETHGLGGGFFASRDAALRFARGECGRRLDAVDLVDRLRVF